jgi:hypothetical protein
MPLIYIVAVNNFIDKINVTVIEFDEGQLLLTI